MALGPIDFPFLNDGLGYFSKLAIAYNQEGFFSGLALLWKTQEQGLLLFSWLYFLLKLTGFSYQTLVWGQIAWSLGVLVGISAFLSRKLPALRVNKALFFSLLLAVFLGFGFFTAVPGNVFDLRVDISGALWLSLALLSLYQPDWKTILFVGLAFLERFHNMSVLVVVVFSLSAFQFFYLERTFSLKERLFSSKFFLSLALPFLGIAVVTAFRWSAVKRLIEYYSRVQMDSSSDWVVEWGGKGFFSFYPEQFYSLFTGTVGLVVFLILFCFTLLILITEFRKNKTTVRLELQYVEYLIFCFVLILAMLIVNPTRNNGGVLRFALAPLMIAFSLLGAYFLTLKCSSKKQLLYSFAFVLILSVVGLRRGFLFYNNFDYQFFRSSNLKAQVLSAYDRIYEVAEGSSDGLSVGALYAQEYNFNAKLWPIYLAFTEKPSLDVTYSSRFGTQHRVVNLEQEVLAQFEGLDFLAIGNEECFLDWIPADRSYREFLNTKRSRVKEFCPSVVSELEMGACRVELRRCSGQAW